MSTAFISAVSPPSTKQQPAYWFIFQGFRLLVHDDEIGVRIPLVHDPSALSLELVRNQYLGLLQEGGKETHCYSGEVEEEINAPDGMEFLGLRSLFDQLDDEMLALAGRAVQIVDWDRTHQYCGQCGSEVIQLGHERAKQCPKCDYTSYPRISPAIIVSVERPADTGTELLLARNHRFPDGFYSVLAGFVEPGESLEDCVSREVREEVGIEVKDIRYFGSQSWPFPNSLMIAFTARYAGGRIRLEEEEIADADWFRADALPGIPPRVSIARQLIDAFVKRNPGVKNYPGLS